MISVAPNTISGIEMMRPSTISVVSPLAAAAMAMALSRLITASAMMMVRMAEPSASLAALTPSSLSSSPCTSLTPIHSSRRPPDELQEGDRQQIVDDQDEDEFAG